MPLLEATVQACKVRLRPILMTSLATLLGMIPMALGLEAGSEQYAPLARAIIGGLAVSVVVDHVPGTRGIPDHSRPPRKKDADGGGQSMTRLLHHASGEIVRGTEGCSDELQRSAVRFALLRQCLKRVALLRWSHGVFACLLLGFFSECLAAQNAILPDAPAVRLIAQNTPAIPPPPTHPSTPAPVGSQQGQSASPAAASPGPRLTLGEARRGSPTTT